jgi:purine-binding chemotaxis protein CheW
MILGTLSSRISEETTVMPPPTLEQAVGQYLTFEMDREIFALDVLRVREVLDMSPITRVPQSPEFMLGVVNVRGNAIPVIDLRSRFGLPAALPSVNTRIIVLDLEIKGESVSIGAVADAVLEVVGLEADALEPPPQIGLSWREEVVRGIGRREEKFLIVLEIDRILTTAAGALRSIEPGVELDLGPDREDAGWVGANA